MGDTESNEVKQGVIAEKEYTVKKDGHTHRGVVLKNGDKITPSSAGQTEFLKSKGVI